MKGSQTWIHEHVLLAGSVLDFSREAALVAYVALYEADRDTKWLDLARRAAEWMLTFRWSYNLAWPEHTLLAPYDFRLRGGDQASPSNQHLHNYGWVCLPEMLRLWQYKGDDSYLDRMCDNLACFLRFIARADGTSMRAGGG